MIEYENYGKLESLAELENAIEMGLDIEFLRKWQIASTLTKF